jgi:tryptophan synthase beta chain
MDEINQAYEAIRHTPEFQDELNDLFKNYVGRPSPLFHAKRLSDQLGGAQIYLKREDLNHTGAHKINHCLGEALLAKYMGKSKVIAETGAGQHGVALATACALVGIPCEIHMGQVDIEKEHPNVVKMKILGAKLVSVTQGTATLKDAVDSAFEEYLKDPKNYIYAIGSVVGPHPFPKWYVTSSQLLVMKLKFKPMNALEKILTMLWLVLVVDQMQLVLLPHF